MSTRIAAALVVVLAAQPALAEKARERDGSPRGSSAGERHPSPRVSGSSSASSSGSGSSQSSVRSLTDAQRRHPRPGTGSAYRYGYRYPYYRSYYYGYGYYPYSYYDAYYFGGYYPYYYGYGYPYYGRRYGYAYRDAASIRLQIEPSNARVYVDGYYAGIVDDFDGLFQRLHLSPGRHEITLKLEGYKTHRMKVYVPYGDTIKVHYHMAKGGGEDMEDLVGDRYEPEGVRGDRDYRGDADDRRGDADDRRGDADDHRGEADDRDDDDRPAAREGRSEHGRLRMNVRPADASVYVDGQFRGSGKQVERLELPPGRHRIEVVRPGFRTFDREVEVRPGDTVDVDVELERP